ncbi:hypothetical protein [Halegenticoccus tardaugens]|uniref:hypothetical protein n=1 Tax=Halegenticoccus tardaugens TaxID=2071624 RepID=UPI0013E98DCC|nr:hypothetical protein [Halegenticoccus tardaugens]
MRSHACRRCGARFHPARDVYAAVDVMDAQGDLKVLLCRDCARALRGFLGAE